VSNVRGILTRICRHAAIPAIGMALIAFISFIGTRPGIHPETLPAKPRKIRPAEPMPRASSEVSWTAPAEPVPMPVAAEPQTAAAMDDAGLRYQLARLRMAALAGDPQVTESVQVAVRRYGRGATAFLSSEIEKESDPVVREAFLGARNGLR
jgi:hypothetical protein